MLLNITKAGRLDLALPSFRNCRLQIVSSNPSFLNKRTQQRHCCRELSPQKVFFPTEDGLNCVYWPAYQSA
jgi:hypothetical protein